MKVYPVDEHKQSFLALRVRLM